MRSLFKYLIGGASVLAFGAAAAGAAVGAALSTPVIIVVGVGGAVIAGTAFTAGYIIRKEEEQGIWREGTTNLDSKKTEQLTQLISSNAHGKRKAMANADTVLIVSEPNNSKIAQAQTGGSSPSAEPLNDDAEETNQERADKERNRDQKLAQLQYLNLLKQSVASQKAMDLNTQGFFSNAAPKTKKAANDDNTSDNRKKPK